MASRAQTMIEAMPAAFLADKAGNAKALILLDLTGPEGGKWYVDIAGGQCQVRQETAAAPDVTVTMDVEDFALLYENKLNPVQAFMGGKIKVTGNVGLVMQLLNWFQR